MRDSILYCIWCARSIAHRRQPSTALLRTCSITLITRLSQRSKRCALSSTKSTQSPHSDTGPAASHLLENLLPDAWHSTTCCSGYRSLCAVHTARAIAPAASGCHRSSDDRLLAVYQACPAADEAQSLPRRHPSTRLQGAYKVAIGELIKEGREHLCKPEKFSDEASPIDSQRLIPAAVMLENDMFVSRH